MAAKTPGSNAGSALFPDGRRRRSVARIHGGAVIRFRGYQVHLTTRRLLLDDREIIIGGRAFDLLVALLGARGTVVSQSDLIRSVWPSAVVDDSNLRFQIGALRRVLGDDQDIIKTIPRRGYLLADECDQRVAERDHLFTGAGVEWETSGASAPSRSEPAPQGGVPSPPSQGEALERGGTDGRLAELEQENLRLRLAIADLTLGRLSDEPWKRSYAGDPGRFAPAPDRHGAIELAGSGR